ncbi:MAG: hypothetical protein U0990_11475 [Candidatus Nanopelagicales bacterium]|nr:hypothetical protein [Candidatus Nanopelagicales bacterium]MDZ4250687.1 hypothetical protein [Candidatus Nanopelagicales bacterium]
MEPRLEFEKHISETLMRTRREPLDDWQSAVEQILINVGHAVDRLERIDIALAAVIATIPGIPVDVARLFEEGDQV